MFIKSFSELKEIMEADLYRRVGQPIDFKQIIRGWGGVFDSSGVSVCGLVKNWFLLYW